MSFTFHDLKKTFSLFVPPYLFKNKIVRIRWSLSILLILMDVAATSLVPYFSKRIVDTLAVCFTQSVWFMVAFLGLFWIIEKTITHAQEIIFFPIINTAIRDLTYRTVEHIHQIPLNAYKRLSIPETINSIRRISFSARSFIKILLLLLFPTVLKLLVAVWMTIQAGLFGIILFPSILLAFLVLYYGTKRYVRIRNMAWQASDKTIKRIHDSFLNTKTVRAFKDFEMQQIGRSLKKEAYLWHKSNTRLHMMYILISTFIGITITAILAYTIIAIQQKKLSVGDFVFLKGQLIAVFLPFRIFSLEFRQLAEALIDVKKIIKIFEIPKQENLDISDTASPVFKKGIYLKNIDFSYDAHHKIFNNLSLDIPPGEKLAIIGESGCGKSTLLNLIASLYQPTQGHIYIDGQELHLFHKDMLPQKIYHIHQDFRLFNTSLRNNITYGLGEISEAHLIKIIKQVRLLNLVQKLPWGLDTVVGEMGTKLSGGEKQKVALARVLLLKPDILLLDETTSSINSETEYLILNLLLSTIPTVIFATHRTSSLAKFTRILKLKEGNLFEMDIFTNKTEFVV